MGTPEFDQWDAAASAAKANGNWAEAEVNYRHCFDAQPSAYYASMLTKSMRKQSADRAEDAVNFATTARERWPEDQWLAEALAWALYDAKISDANCDDAGSTRAAVEAALLAAPLIPVDDRRWTAIQPAVRRAKDGGLADAALQLLATVDPDRLSLEPREYAGKRLPSHREMYDEKLVPCLLSVGRLDEAIAAAQAATARFSRTHYFPWWDGKARAEQGNHDEAILKFQQANALKHEWWIDQDIASSLTALGQDREALLYLCRAGCAAGQEAKFLVSLIDRLAECLERIGLLDVALDHLYVTSAIATKEGWARRSEDAARRIAEFSNRHPEVASENQDLKSLLSRARAFWMATVDEATPRYTGTIARLPEGKSFAFVRPSNGCPVKENLFFKLSDARGVEITEGLEVTFSVAESYDRTKKRTSHVAKDIRPA